QSSNIRLQWILCGKVSAGAANDVGTFRTIDRDCGSKVTSTAEICGIQELRSGRVEFLYERVAPSRADCSCEIWLECVHHRKVVVGDGACDVGIARSIDGNAPPSSRAAAGER